MQARTFRLGTEQGLVPRLDVSRPKKERRYPGLVWPQVSLRVAGAEVEDWVWDACVEGAAGLPWDFLQISRPSRHVAGIHRLLEGVPGRAGQRSRISERGKEWWRARGESG